MAVSFEQTIKVLYPWMTDGLIDVYVNEWVNSGDADLAILAVRSTTAWERIFPGIRREDGSLRMSENEYLSTLDAFDETIFSYGLNPDVILTDELREQLVAGDVSPDEFAARIADVHNRILLQGENVRTEFADTLGVDVLTDEAILAAAINPAVGDEYLSGQITLARISGEAFTRGYRLTTLETEQYRTLGVTEDTAAGFFAAAELNVPVLTAIARRQNSRFGGLDEFAQLELAGNAATARKVADLLAADQAAFTPRNTVASSGSRLTGLRPA